MSAATYVVPENPADPEAAAYEMIVQFPAAVLAEPGVILHPLIEVLQDYAGMLQAQGAFAGLAWEDAKNVAAAVAFDLCQRDEAAEFLRWRARNVLAGADNMTWASRENVARALNVAADTADL